MDDLFAVVTADLRDGVVEAVADELATFDINPTSFTVGPEDIAVGAYVTFSLTDIFGETQSCVRHFEVEGI